MTDQEKIALLNKLIEFKRGRDEFLEKFEHLFGVMNGFPGSSDGLYKVFDRLFDEYCDLVAEKIGDSKESIGWFVYENDCGEKGLECGFDGEMKQIKNAEDYIEFLNVPVESF